MLPSALGPLLFLRAYLRGSDSSGPFSGKTSLLGRGAWNPGSFEFNSLVLRWTLKQVTLRSSSRLSRPSSLGLYSSLKVCISTELD